MNISDLLNPLIPARINNTSTIPSHNSPQNLKYLNIAPATLTPSYPSPESVINSSSATSPKLPNKKFKCPEQGCDKAFTRKYNLSAHLRCHRSEKPYSCTQCPLNFARKHDLSRHIKSIHELKKSFGPCATCGAYFTRSDALARHLKVEQERLLIRSKSFDFNLHSSSC
ncbi:hypothetical protein BC833DRAFT_608846, partial [Globomyces pollinis-pini]